MRLRTRTKPSDQARAAATGFLALTLAGAGAPACAASALALSCMGCHLPAVDAREMPALNRLSRDQIARSLREARDRPQPGSIMARLASKFSDAEIDQLAAELASPAGQ